MTNAKKTKRALLSSVIALFLCFAMLLGTTYAWFTDSVISNNNIIKSGNLDVEMFWAEGTEDPTTAAWEDASTTAIFNYDNWEPGYVDVKHVKIVNNGTLALKYQVKIMANGEVSDLSDVIEVYYVDPAQAITDRAQLIADNYLGTLTEVLAGLDETASGKLAEGEAHTITLALKMQESAGNQYQNKSIGTNFSVIVLATQATVEEDSFDDQYDANATFAAELNNFKAALANAQAGDTVTLNLTHDAYLSAGEKIIAPDGVDVVVNGNGYTIYADNAQVVFGAKRNSDMTIKNVTIVGKTTDDAIISQNNGVGDPVNIVMENVKVNLTDIKGVNWPVCFGGTGAATLTNCEITGAGIESGDYADGNQFFAGAKMNVTFVNTKIDSVMLNGSQGGDSATLNIDAASKVGVVILEAKTTSVISGDATGIKSILIPGMSEQEADAAIAKEIETVLQNGGDVILVDDITFSSSDTTSNSGYGATGVSVKGGTLDGNGNSLGINNWGTWDAAVHTTGGTIKNLTVNSGMRGIFMGSASADVYIDNVVIDGTIYTFNSDGGSKDYGVYISNSTLNGWTSFSDVHKEVVFTNCTFGKGNGYAFCRPYNAPSVFKNCVFEEGFEFDTSKTSDITFINCYYGDTLITAANAATLAKGETIFFYNGLNGATIDDYKAVVGDGLGAALEKGENVVLTENVNNASATKTAPYGNYYSIAQNGGVFDGNGNTLDFDKGPQENGKYDNYGIMISGGTIKNLTITGIFRGIMIMNPTEDIYIYNVTLGDKDMCYAINTGEGDGTHSLYVSDSTIKGWSSYGPAIKDVTFEGCIFAQGEYYTDVFGRLVKPYVDTVFENCEFNSKFYIDLSQLGKDGDGNVIDPEAKIVLENCTVNGVKLTADNWKELIATEDDCGEGQISIELKDGSYLTAENIVDYVIFK